MIEKMRKALDAAVEAIGGQPREGQIAMAEAVANALSDRHHLLVQAGTGTGKSLAYIVPALVHGRKVLVATATLALQRQLVDRDLPAVVPVLEKELLASMAEVEVFLRNSIEGKYPLVIETSRHLVDAGGKRLRPLLTLIASHFGDSKAKVILSVFPSGIEHMFEELGALPQGPPDFPKVAEICGRYGINFI